MKDYDENRKQSYLEYWHLNNLHGLPILQKLPVNGFEQIKDFVKKHNEESNEGYFLEVDVQYLEKLDEFHNDLLFLSERKKVEKVEMLVANLYEKTEYALHIRNLKQTLNHGLVF